MINKIEPTKAKYSSEEPVEIHRKEDTLFKMTPLSSYAGIAPGLWGDSSEAIDHFIRNERDSWE